MCTFRYIYIQVLITFPWNYLCTYPSASPDHGQWLLILGHGKCPMTNDRWKASHMANAFWWAWRREHTKSCSRLIVYDTSSITTPPRLLYLLNSAIQILIIFWTYQVISCSSVFKFSNSHTPSLWEEDWQNQAFFQVSVHVSFILFPKKVWHHSPLSLFPKFQRL